MFGVSQHELADIANTFTHAFVVCAEWVWSACKSHRLPSGWAYFLRVRGRGQRRGVARRETCIMMPKDKDNAGMYQNAGLSENTKSIVSMRVRIFGVLLCASAPPLMNTIAHTPRPKAANSDLPRHNTNSTTRHVGTCVVGPKRSWTRPTFA